MLIDTTVCPTVPSDYSSQSSNSHEETHVQMLPLSFLKSGQFLVLPATCRGGLIIEKRFYADLVGPGAAVGAFFDSTCTKVYPIGEIQFFAPTTQYDRQQAFQKRIACNRRLQQISQNPSALSRASQTIELLYRWLGEDEAGKIPDELVARVAAVLPKTIDIVRRLKQNDLPLEAPQSSILLTPQPSALV